jgi:hypothetical protein
MLGVPIAGLSSFYTYKMVVNKKDRSNKSYRAGLMILTNFLHRHGYSSLLAIPPMQCERERKRTIKSGAKKLPLKPSLPP